MEVDGLERTNRDRRGFLLGGVFALSAVVSDAMWTLANRAADAPQSTPAQRLWLAVTVTILGTGLVVGCVAVLRTRSRRFGWGMLLGLVVTFPVLWLLMALLMWGGQ
jgi:hypothetical protein